MRSAILIPALAALCALSTAALAGSPDNPGGGGQAVQDAAKAYQEFGTNFGQAVSEFTHNGGNLGEAVQDAKHYSGGDPNPANDNGGGND